MTGTKVATIVDKYVGDGASAFLAKAYAATEPTVEIDRKAKENMSSGMPRKQAYAEAVKQGFFDWLIGKFVGNYEDQNK